MDTPQRANAAQLAARQLKAKPKGRLQSGRFNSGLQSGGNMLGGSLQGAGSFNPTAPGGLSIPTPSFGSFGSNSTVSPDTDPEPGRFFGDDRATKRQFGGPSTIKPSQPAFQPNGFGQSQPNTLGNVSQPSTGGFSFGGPPATPTPAITFGSGANMSASSQFSFGGGIQSAPANPAINFGSGANENRPANTPYAFGQQNAPPPASNSPFVFGSTAAPATPQPPASSSIFNFGASAAPEKSAASNSPFQFGSTAMQQKPAASPFIFGQNAATPSSSGVNFGSTTTTAPPMSNLFGTSTGQPTSIFASSTQSPPPTKYLFGNSNVAPAPKNDSFGRPNTGPAPANGLFGNSNAGSAPPSNLFGSREQSPAPAAPPSNLFGSQSQQPASSTSNFFGASTQPSSSPKVQEEKPAATTNSIFSGLNNPAASATSNFFSSPKPQPPPSNNMFGKSDQMTPANPFKMLNKPVDDSVKQSQINGSDSDATPKPNPPSIFTQSNNSASLFGQSQPSHTRAAEDNRNNSDATAKPLFSLGSSSSSQPTNIFSPMKNLAAPPADNQPAPSAMFPRLPEPTQSSERSLAPPSPQKALENPNLSNSQNAQQPIPDDSNDERPLIPDVFNITHEQIDPYLPTGLDEYARMNHIVQLQLNSLNTGMATLFSELEAFTDPSGVFRRYIDARKKYMDEWEAFKANYNGGITNCTSSSKLPRQTGMPASGQSTQSLTKRKLVEDEDQENENPGKRAKEQDTPAQPPFQAQSQAQAPVNGAPEVDGASTHSKPLQSTGSPFKPAPTFSQNVSSTPFAPAPSTSGLSSKPAPAFSQNGSSTSFAPTTSTPNTPLKSAAATSSQNESSASPPANPSISKGKRKAEEQLTEDTKDGVSPLRQIKTPRLNGSTSTTSNPSNTSNIFKSILDSPSQPSSSSKIPERKMAPLRESKDEPPRFNPFGNIPVPGSPAKVTSSPSPAPVARVFPPTAFTPKNPSSLSNMFTAATPSPPNIFEPKVTAARAAMPSLAQQFSPNFIAKPPVMSSADALAQFARKAAENKKKEEKKREDDKFDNDYDSEEDGDPEEWRKKYRAARKIELDELEALGKKLGQGFKVKPLSNGANPSTPVKPLSNGANTNTLGSTFKGFGDRPSLERSTSPADSVQPSIEPKPIFGSTFQPQGSGMSAFSSVNASRASTPGLFGSSSGSILDGTASSKPLTGVKNPFAHLSPASGAQADEAGEDSEGEENDDDEENKDPSYKPADSSASGPGTPSTPANEHGADISSAMKPNPVGFGGYGTPKTSTIFGASIGTSAPGGNSFSGFATTSSTPSIFERFGKKPESASENEQSANPTPGRSLFDIMGTDANGKPMGKVVSTEEKENTQPITTGSFGSSIFSKRPGAPADNTWKPDSPIKFGESTSAPAVSVTAATPTNAPSSNLFGGKDPKPAPAASHLSNLLPPPSTPNGPAPSILGFSFGAPGAVTSLLPSTAASATTSRATSPGVTTDGDSGVEHDPDAEKQEQINLTTVGPGEENEEVVLEVRAKATKFEKNESGWVSKGLGPLRVLKHKETKSTRILLRADPSGSIILNKALLSNVEYTQNKKTVKIMVLADVGTALEIYILQVKTEESAKNLAEVLEANKVVS
ncbi:uncharacterized protein L3040_000338 [Drepanopeziza brunnea f. sp. 'multigermtubi']|uniref:RanBP1 domain protein n=1 Tax=Marssonina brunnea f. sp. multigermtubi (strain MB_m1) TaxID=1072389 RepID=K1WG77_MARBU|nr:RanBP1 domain protein [Drepanopeziza brunnea f. sp. 'multigermtubi' MB_m1]EKD11856.1 RanBP1 domain protein [Drepanopeziza brunnea f. sp. 'multigermtubi' MB_m1]KAJ5054054.1 hypothetical protein L3040_000338 [Drepanopeziza brunnea f. sp. 'multigermtubi']